MKKKLDRVLSILLAAIFVVSVSMECSKLNATTFDAGFAARAEENCGVMLYSSTRVNGVIDAVKPLAGWSGDIIDSGAIDPRFVVAITVTSVTPNPIFQADEVLKKIVKGRKLNFAIHSPSLYLGGSPNAGDPIEVEITAMQCDGVFRRFTSVRKPTSLPEQFNGSLEVGTIYKADVQWSETGAISFTTPIEIPFHHGVGVDWNNPQDLPKVDSKTVVFKVDTKEIRQVGTREWRTMYSLHARP